MPTINSINEREREREDKCDKCQTKPWEVEITETQNNQEKIIQLCAECQEIYNELWKCQECGESCGEECNSWCENKAVINLCKTCSWQRVFRNQQTTNKAIQQLASQLRWCRGTGLITTLFLIVLVLWEIWQNKEKLKRNRKSTLIK